MPRTDARKPQPSPAPVFSALGDTTRLELVSRLGDGQPRSISQLAEGLGQTRQGVTKHLRILEQAGIIASQRIGRESRFVITSAPFIEIRTYLDRVSAQWDDALSRLKGFVED